MRARLASSPTLFLCGFLVGACSASGGSDAPPDAAHDASTNGDDAGTDHDAVTNDDAASSDAGSNDAGNTDSATTPVDGGAPSPGNGNGMGFNIREPSDWSLDWLFADVIKTSRLGFADKIADASVPVDENGWPTVDPSFYLFPGGVFGNAAGHYAISFTGQGDLSGTLTITNAHYDAATNTTTADGAYSGSGDAFLVIRNTKRTPSSAAGSGVTNVKVMKPGYTAADTFTKPIKALLAKVSAIRFMDFTATNWNVEVHWSDRLPPTYSTMQVDTGANGYGWEGRGAAWEYAIQLANETGRDAYLNVPVKADDDYVTQLAKLVHDKLDPKLHVYVEYSNEVWNGGFQQAHDNHDMAVAEVAAGNSPLDYDKIGDTGGWTYAWRRTAKRAMEISNIFRTVFGDAAMMTRVRPLLEWQQQDGQATGMVGLTFLDAYYGNGDGNHVSDPHPPNYFFYGGGGSAYYGPDDSSDSLTLDGAWSSATMDLAAFATVCQADVDWTAAFGLVRVAYEGGPSLDKTGHSDDVKPKLWTDPRMQQAVIDHHKTWLENGGGLLMYFQSTGDYQWGFTGDVTDLATPKTQAIDAIAALGDVPATYGALLPGDLDPSKPQVFNTWDRHADNMKAGDWFGWTVRVASASTLKVAVRANVTSAAQVELIVDGTSRGVVPLAVGNGQSTAPQSIAFTPGIHSISVRDKAGAFGVTAIHAGN